MNAESFFNKPAEVQEAIHTGDTEQLRTLGKKGAAIREQNALMRDLQAEDAAREALQELDDAHLITEEGAHAITGEDLDPTAFKRSILAMRKRMIELEKKNR
jgi:hypothetical protein